LLLEAGADVDAGGEFDMTPLHWAAASGSEETVTKLLDAGADATRTSWFYLTPGELAMLNERDAAARVIARRSGLVSRGVSVAQILERMRDARFLRLKQ
jgi:ankyrin repeat protein